MIKIVAAVVFGLLARLRCGLFLLMLTAISGPPTNAHQTSPAGQALVSLSGEDKVILIATDSGRIAAAFPVIKGPHEITVSVDRKHAYVANAGSGPGGEPGWHVSVLDLRGRVTRSNHYLGSCAQPHDVRVNRDGTVLWIACAPAKAVLEVDARTGAMARAWPTPLEGGHFIVVTADGRKIYVPHLEGKGATVIDRQRGVARTLFTGGAQSGIDISPDDREVWVIDHERRRINIVSVDDDRVAASIELVSGEFGRLRFTPNGRRVVLVQGKRFAVFDTVRRREVASIDMPLAGKVVSVSSAGDRAIVSNPTDNRITVVQLSPLRVVSSVVAGKAPDGVAWLE